MQSTPWIFLNVLIILLIAPLSAYALHRYFRRDRRRELLAFGVLTFGILAWELTSIGIDAASSVDGKLFWYNLGNAVTAPLMLYAFLWFAVTYSRFDRFDSKWIGVLGAIHVTVVGTVLALRPTFLYEPVGLLQRGPLSVAGVTFEEWVVLDRTLGMPFKLSQLYIYALTLLGGVIFVRFLYHNRSAVSKQQMSVVVIGVLSPLVVNALVFLGIVTPDLNVTDVAFGVTGIAFAIAMFRYRLFSVIPIGREQLVETMTDPVVMLDEESRVVDSNAAARALSGTSEDWRGTQAAAFLAPFSDLVERLDTGESLASEIEITVDGTDRHFDLDVSAIPSDRQEHGTLIVLREITERKARERQLETQRNNLEVLNTMMRHDIRNSLQLVTASGETLEDYVVEEGESYLEQAQSAADEAIEITRTARDVTEVLLKDGSETKPVQIRPVLHDQIEDVRSMADTAEITVSGSLEPVEVLADDLLGSVFRNLLKNAIEHNDAQHPNVIISTTRCEETVRVSVADNGPGIPDELRESVFEEGTSGLDSDGTGLGLYLVRTLVDRYDGDVWIEDNDPRGSVVIVELPVAE